MKKSEFAYEQENTAFLCRSFFLMTVLAEVLQLEQCPFMNIRMCIIPVCYLFLLWAAVRLAAKGTDAPVTSVMIFGIFFIAGGVIFDLSSTIISSPDLEREGNVYIRHLLDSGHSLTFAYFYLFTVLIITGGLDIVLLIALLKNRSLIVSKNRSLTALKIYVHLFWVIALLLNISSNIDHWTDGMGWHGIALYRITGESVRMGCLYFCLSLYTVLLWETHRQLYQPELKAGFRLCAVSVCIFIITVSTLFYVRSHVNKINLSYLDGIINYAAENSLLKRYAEIDDAIQKITSNPYIRKKQTNGADALSEYCPPDTEESREEFVSSVKKTADMLDFSERLKLDNVLAAAVDSFSTEIADKAWMYNVLFFREKHFAWCDEQNRTVLFFEHKSFSLGTFYHYSEIMAVRICRMYRQGKKNTAKELYMKTLHMSRMLFNGDSLVSQVAGLAAMKKLCRDEIISLDIFSEYERKHLNRFKENLLFLIKNDTALRKFYMPKKLAEPLVFYYPDRYSKVMTLLEPHRDRNYILPVYYEMLGVRESLCILDGGSGILFPLQNDRRFKEIMRIFNTEKKFLLKKALRCVDKNIETCKSENCNPTERNAYLTDSKLKFIYKIASEWNSKALLWYLRPFIWNESLVGHWGWFKSECK